MAVVVEMTMSLQQNITNESMEQIPHANVTMATKKCNFFAI